MELSFQVSAVNDAFENWRNVVGREGSNTSFTSLKTISTCSMSGEEHTQTEYSSETNTSIGSYLPNSHEEHVQTK